MRKTGIAIAGWGISVDAVVADYIAGASERLVLEGVARGGELLWVEGQGSLLHPAYSGVALALLHGSQPDVIVACSDAARTALLGHDEYPLPPVEEIIDLNLRLGARTHPAIRCGGVTINTSSLAADAADALLDREADRLGLPVADPIRGGPRFARLVEDCLRP